MPLTWPRACRAKVIAERMCEAAQEVEVVTFVVSDLPQVALRHPLVEARFQRTVLAADHPLRQRRLALLEAPLGPGTAPGRTRTATRLGSPSSITSIMQKSAISGTTMSQIASKVFSSDSVGSESGSDLPRISKDAAIWRARNSRMTTTTRRGWRGRRHHGYVDPSHWPP